MHNYRPFQSDAFTPCFLFGKTLRKMSAILYAERLPFAID